MNGMKMKKCSGKTHSVVQLLLILWMTSLIHIAIGDSFTCSRSDMIVSVTLVCDGYYECDNYEDESSCNYPATYLPVGESHFISVPTSNTRRTYNAYLLQTSATNGFRFQYQRFSIHDHDEEFLIGTGNDPSDIESVITTIHGHYYYNPDDVYVDTNEMWFAAIGGSQRSRHRIVIGVTAIDLLNLFPCSGSNVSVSVTLVCDGFYNCDNYEDESTCDLTDYPATYIPEGESHFISLSYDSLNRLYNATLLQTTATYGFRVGFQDLYLSSKDVLQIGSGNDPSDIQSVITTIHGFTGRTPDDVYVDTNEMWFTALGGWQKNSIRVNAGVTAIDLLNLFPCSGSNMSVSETLVCDGFYNCDNYEDESICDYSATFIEEGDSHSISFSRTTTIRLYNASILKTNAPNGFRVVFHHDHEFEVQIGTGNDPSDIQSVISTIDRDISEGPDDVYVDTNEMWLAVIGAKRYSMRRMDVEVISIDLSTLFACSSSNMSVSPTVLCDGIYHCDHYEDELACNFSAKYLEEGESHFISLPRTHHTRNIYLFNATILQTSNTNGFRIVFQDLHLSDNDLVQVGTGNDPSDIQSAIAIMTGFLSDHDDVYVDTNEMWFAIIAGKSDHWIEMIEMDVQIISIDLATFFVCSSSNMSVSTTVLCDGIYQCDHYEDELACNHSAIYLEEGESHDISLPWSGTKRLYNAYILQTNAPNGFQVVFRNLHASLYGAIFQIGTGNNPSDIESVITTIQGYVWGIPDDVYVGTNEMWFAIIIAKGYNRRKIVVEIISIDLSPFVACSSSNRIVSKTALCDGLYDCDHYEDESACNYSSKYFEKGESYFIHKSYPARRLYNVTLLQTNAMIGFRVVFQDLYLYDDGKVQIGTGNDPFDIQSVITTIHGYTQYAPDDVYVDNNEMWFAVIGSKIYTSLRMDVEIISIDLSTICQNISWISPRFERVEFPVGENGTWANSTGMCPFNTTQANVPIGRALCIADGITQSQWQPVDNCGPFRNVTDILTEIAKVIVTEENAGEVSQQVSYVASNFEDITSDDITLVAEITSNIVQQNLTGEEVTKSLTSIVSNIAQVKTWELEAAEEEGGAISEFLQAFEEQISRVEVADGGMLNIQQPNVAVQVQSVLADDVTRGLVLSLAGCSLSDLTKSNITIDAPTRDERDDVIATRPDIIAQVNIPPSVLSAISSTAQISGSPSNGSGEYVRFNFIVFSTPALFISKSLRTISPDNNLPGKTLDLCVRPPRYNLEDLSPYTGLYIKLIL